MADVADRAGEVSASDWNISTRYLPGLESRDLPEPRSLGKYLGASVILLATALGSGELILWPYITAQVGMGLLWLAFIGFTFQYFLNMEIERYTLATGETAVTGFTRLWKPWGIFFVLGAILPNAWPGWATGAATLFTYQFGIEAGYGVALVATIALLSIGIAITASPVIYQTVEKIQFVLVGIILLFLVTAIVIATNASSWTGIVTQAPTGVANFTQYAGDLGAALLLGAIAFAGAGGANNLCQSNYVRDKGMGMGANIPNIVSPVTGDEEAAPSIGYTFPTTEENLRRWRKWWKLANQEQLITFYAIGLLTLISLSVLVNSTLGIIGEPEEELAFVQDEAVELGNIIAPWFGTFFIVAGMVILFSTNLGILDYVARITADSLKVSVLARSVFWTESKIYFIVVWVMIVAGSTILWLGLDQPIVLLVIASAGGGVVMAFYSVLLILLNRNSLPEQIRLKSWRLPIMYVIAVFFIGFSLYLVYDLAVNGVG